MLNVENMLTGYVTRMRYVFRHSTSFHTHRESVPEHAYFTSLYAMLIAREVVLSPEVQLLAVQRALMHDVEESRTGDVPHPFKYSSDELRHLMHQAAQSAMYQVAHSLGGGGTSAESLFEMWQQSKADDVAGFVVALADHMSMVSFAVQEIENGNASFVNHLRGVEESLQSVRDHFSRVASGSRNVNLVRLGAIVDEVERVQKRLGRHDGAANGG